MRMAAPDPNLTGGKSNAPEFSASLRRAAELFLARNWSIIPLSGKRPALTSWKEFQTRRATPREVADWFSPRRLGVTGVGIVTGRLSRLVVVDCDTTVDAQHWQERFPPSPLVAFTGGGGTHFYYAMPADQEVRNRAGVFHRKIDVRGEGGYATAPPSCHPNGMPYRWATGESHPLPPFDPAWVAHAISPLALPATHAALNCRNVAAYIMQIEAISGQGGHNATYRVACRLRDAGLSPDDALSLLGCWNETNAIPPWSEAELAHKIRSAYQSPRPRDASSKLF